jgi:hypothetical protein
VWRSSYPIAPGCKKYKITSMAPVPVYLISWAFCTTYGCAIKEFSV